MNKASKRYSVPATVSKKLLVEPSYLSISVRFVTQTPSSLRPGICFSDSVYWHGTCLQQWRFATYYTLLNLLFEFGLERTGVKHVPERKFIANKLFGFRDNWNSGKFISLQSCIRSKTCSYESTTVDFGVLLSLAPVLHHTSKFEMFRNHNL